MASQVTVQRLPEDGNAQAVRHYGWADAEGKLTPEGRANGFTQEEIDRILSPR